MGFNNPTRMGVGSGLGFRHTCFEIPNLIRIQKNYKNILTIYIYIFYITNFQTLINLILNSQFLLLSQPLPPLRLMPSLPLSPTHAHAHPHSHRPIDPFPPSLSLSQLTILIIASVCFYREKSLCYTYINFIHRYHDLYQIIALF